MTAPRIPSPEIDIDRIEEGDTLAIAEGFRTLRAAFDQLATAASVRVGRWRDAQLTTDNFRTDLPWVWTVATGNIISATFLVVDDLMMFRVYVAGTSLNHTAFVLEIDLPRGYQLSADAGDLVEDQLGFVWWSEDGPPLTWHLGWCTGQSGQRKIRCFRGEGVATTPFPLDTIGLRLFVTLQVTRG